MELINKILTVVIVVSLIMLMIQVFKNINKSNDDYTLYKSSSINNSELIEYSINQYIDCNYVDVDNVTVYFNKIPIDDYYTEYSGYVHYRYIINCNDNSFNMSIKSEYPIIVSIDWNLRDDINVT
jgi:hypothetical protein